MRVTRHGIIQALLIPALIMGLLHLSGCSSSEPNTSTAGQTDNPNNESSAQGTMSTGGQVSDAYAASRFLAQTTFGPTTEAIEQLRLSTYDDWITNQFEMPAKTLRDDFDALQALNPDSAPSRDWIFESFWRRSVTSEDQLRQRVAFALSQLFVISLRDGGVAAFPRGAADFYSRLELNAFGNFRTLLEEVTLHPMMGAYLSHLGNEKGDPSSGRQPDENFAREVMQLFTIGLYELNPDGTQKLSAIGEPIETYSNADVQGLAKVFTGFSWNGPDTTLGRFQGWISVPDRDIQLMQAYPEHHSLREKRFLGTVIPAGEAADPKGDLTRALDVLFDHPNTGPFIAKQLIQRLITSNPDSDYVARVANIFADNGSGVRGDMRAVIRAILTDTAARTTDNIDQPNQGRIREPTLRVTHWMRSFNAQSASGYYSILGTDDPATNIGMTVLRSPSVFNFYRPQYVPPGTTIAQNKLVSPEMQITHETSVAGYFNSMLSRVVLGDGSNNEVQANYANEIAVANDPTKLVERMNLLLLHGTMSSELRDLITQAIELVPIDANNNEALLARAHLAVYLTMSSPEYVVLK